MSDKILGYLLRILLTGLSWFPRSVMQGLSQILGYLLESVFRYRLETVERNLANAFPNKALADRDQIRAAYYRHLAGLVFETIRFIRRRTERMERVVQIKQASLLQNLAQAGQHVVILAGHMGNWEFFSTVMVRCGFETLAVYKPQSNPLAEDVMNRVRLKKGVELTAMKDALRQFHNKMNREKPVALLLVADQIPAKGDIHYWQEFLNQDTAWFTGGGKIASKYNLPVVYLQVEKLRFDRYRIEPVMIQADDPSNKEIAITREYVSLLEKNIHEQPSIWLWSHRRWKYTRGN